MPTPQTLEEHLGSLLTMQSTILFGLDGVQPSDLPFAWQVNNTGVQLQYFDKGLSEDISGQASTATTTPPDVATPLPNTVDADDDELVALSLTLIPQRLYVARHQAPADIRRIEYKCAGVTGVRLGATGHGLGELDDAFERTSFESFKKKIHYRLEWPGYKPFKYAKNVRGKDGPITRTVVVQQIVEMIQQFIEDNASRAPDASAAQWRVGPGAITLADLVLVGVDIVSQGSVQPRLAIRA
ncbi:hypothetical protein NM688_g588 [Phlebia brevispora]|uniref:Uncharacterized protein n=1 Tax=Phlebia brevispora TaxID=194682 RepID=A0ACC1TDS8_9APHY|nr:hypothetical protein NM688_g588 [Phlebia brevispora]